MRADALHKLLLSDRGRAALTLADIATLPDLRSWDRHVLGAAIGDIVADGRLADDEFGRLVVGPVEPST